MKITVLGCGALGQIWLAALEQQGHDVQGWLRVPQPYCSVNVVGLNGETANKTFIANDPTFLADSELLIVTLKAWQVSESVKNMQSVLPAHCPVLLLHNGMGTLDELKGLPQPLLRGVTPMPPDAMALSSCMLLPALPILAPSRLREPT